MLRGWNRDMANRPSDLAERMRDWDEPVGGYVRETLRLPVEAARSKAREIISQCPQAIP